MAADVTPPWGSVAECHQSRAGTGLPVGDRDLLGLIFGDRWPAVGRLFGESIRFGGHGGKVRPSYAFSCLEALDRPSCQVYLFL